jgi:Ricin-type beta-trefoil lectin domain-like
MKSTWRYRLLTIFAAIILPLGLGVLLSLPGTAQAATCTTYYISASTGSDSNSGCSSSAAWASLANVNATTFAAGDQILFADGGSWTGELHPLGSGSSGSPIVISSYGSGSAPIIAGGGAAAAIYLDDQQYWTIENLQITNTTTSAAVRSGIQLENDTSGILNGIDIIDDNINNVLGYWTSSSGEQPSTSSGIAFNLSDTYATNGWNGVLIQGNTLTNDDAGGIYIGSLAGSGHDEYTTNVVIENNTLTNMGGNDIVCIFCSGALVSNNVATVSGSRYSGAGFWTAVSSGGTWQYNEIYDQTRHGSDGQAFDLDWDDTNNVVQYNYSHDNAYGFFEFCCTASQGSTNPQVRYNISQDDGESFAVFRVFGVASSGTAQIYNNTVYVDPWMDSAITVDYPTDDNLDFTNNVIYNKGSGGYDSSATETWSHNTFYGNHPSTEPTDAYKLTSDPDFVNGDGGQMGLASASAYQLVTGSPDIGTGAVVSGNGGKDYFGNSVSATAAPNRGAYNGSGVTGGFVSTGRYALLNITTGMAVDDNGVTTAGPAITEWAATATSFFSDANQHFAIVSEGSGKYEVVGANGLCLDDLGQTSKGDYIVQETCTGGTTQLWTPTSLGGGYYYLIDSSGQYLDGRGLTTNASALDEWTGTGSTNLQWLIVRVS